MLPFFVGARGLRRDPKLPFDAPCKKSSHTSMTLTLIDDLALSTWMTTLHCLHHIPYIAPSVAQFNLPNTSTACPFLSFTLLVAFFYEGLEIRTFTETIFFFTYSSCTHISGVPKKRSTCQRKNLIFGYGTTRQLSKGILWDSGKFSWDTRDIYRIFLSQKQKKYIKSIETLYLIERTGILFEIKSIKFNFVILDNGKKYQKDCPDER